MSSPRAPRDVAAVLRRRWVLPVIAVVLAAAAAVVTQLIIGDLADVAAPLAVAAVAGLVLGVVAIFVVEALDGTIRSPRDLVRLTSAPNLAVVPRHQVGTERPEDVTMFREPNSIEAEGYRSVRTALEFVLWPPDSRPSAGDDDALLRPLGDGPGKVVLVTSARPGEGKSSVAANLAAASAMAGRRVVLVDGDLRKPQVHRLFRLGNDVGLSSMLTGELKGFAAVQRLDATKHLVVVTGGPPPPDPAEMLAGPRLGAALASMASQSDLVVVDAPPLLAVTDPALIAQHCDATIMVAISGESDRREWAEALRRLAVVEGKVIGTVLMRPDDRANATMTYRYAPSATPKDWWVTDPTLSETTASTSDEVPADHAGDAISTAESLDLDQAMQESLDAPVDAEPAVDTDLDQALQESFDAPIDTEPAVGTVEPPRSTGPPDIVEPPDVIEPPAGLEPPEPAEPVTVTRSNLIDDLWPPRREQAFGQPDGEPVRRPHEEPAQQRFDS